MFATYFFNDFWRGTLSKRDVDILYYFHFLVFLGFCSSKGTNGATLAYVCLSQLYFLKITAGKKLKFGTYRDRFRCIMDV